MDKIDVKDRKILYHLEQDSRQSFRSIGRKVGLTKDVVVSRVKRLEANDVIFNYYTVIDAYKLGYTYFKFYLSYQYITPDLKKEIINCFVKNKHSIVVASVEGNYDLIVIFCCRNLADIYYFWEGTLNKYRDFFANQVFSVPFQDYLYDYYFLLSQDSIIKNKRNKEIVIDVAEKAEIDELDFQILKLISTNARLPTVEIAKKLKSTPTMIHHRLKKLLKLRVIRGYRSIINFSKIGYKPFKADIILKDHIHEHKIMNYLEKSPYLRGRDISLGYADLELTFYLPNASKLHEIIGQISSKFPDSIRNYKYFTLVDIHRYTYFPENL